jgi:hypothetical protein
MSQDLAVVIHQIATLAHNLPIEPVHYEEIPLKQRKALREALESAVSRLGTLALTLDAVRLPKNVFDPTSPEVIGKMVAQALLLQERESLIEAVRHPFYGAGVYAIYYRGGFDCYQPISGKEHPIYVGKADPEAMHAQTTQAQGRRLHSRLKDHNRSISAAQNLDPGDFDCRYLVVKSAWVETAEDLLITQFKPVWNNESKVCYGFGKHGDSATTRSNERSPWDTLHPGRKWALSEDNTPSKWSVEDIRRNIADHLSKYRPS